jgi:hypothetical protein
MRGRASRNQWRDMLPPQFCDASRQPHADDYHHRPDSPDALHHHGNGYGAFDHAYRDSESQRACSVACVHAYGHDTHSQQPSRGHRGHGDRYGDPG